MHTLFYCSVASRIMQDSDILDILKVSRDKNSQHLIKEAIFRLLENIENDDRNISVSLVYDKEIQERSFKNWRIAFADLD